VQDRKDDRVRACEEELRGLAAERRRYRTDLRALADALDRVWQQYHGLVWYFTLPLDNPMRRGGDDPDLPGYVEKYEALGEQIRALRERLESRLP
jgi:hypothetical protein